MNEKSFDEIWREATKEFEEWCKYVGGTIEREEEEVEYSEYPVEKYTCSFKKPIRLNVYFLTTEEFGMVYLSIPTTIEKESEIAVEVPKESEVDLFAEIRRPITFPVEIEYSTSIEERAGHVLFNRLEVHKVELKGNKTAKSIEVVVR